MDRRIQTFRAATMDDAMALVRRELGQDAVVVESKEVARRRLLPWPAMRQEFEVVAQPLPRPSLTREAKAAGASIPTSAISDATNQFIRPSGDTLDVATAPRQLLAPMPHFAFDHVEPVNPAAPDEESSRMASLENSSSITGPIDSQPTVTDENACLDALKAMQAILASLQQRIEPSGKPLVPDELLTTYRQLIDADVEESHARDLIEKLRQHAAPGSLSSPTSIAATLTAVVEREMRCAPPIHAARGRREIVIVVGPTGVGKTTTIAKLAGHYCLREHLRVGMITVDNDRVGAIEQLQTYAEIMQIPLKTAANCDELRTAIDELDDVDLIFIDTAGRGPWDAARMDELCDLVQAAEADQVLLTLSLTSGHRQLVRIANQFAMTGPTSLVLTKLDETTGCGGILSVARDIRVPVSYLTTGQNVPDQIEPAHPNRLARLILGRDSIHAVRNR